MQPDEALAILKQGCITIINEDELRNKLGLDRRLRVKLGVDPSTTDLHLGHSIVLQKLRQFQDFGHQAILIIGDFTGMIGDPSGRSVTRPNLTRDQVGANAKTYFEQAFKILDKTKTEIRYNSEWFAQMSFERVIRLISHITIQQILHRDDFKKRMRENRPIGTHEVLYPIMQGWDSVMVKADVELGGTDQLFNILMGRDLQREEGQPEQVVFLMPLLEGLNGSEKMSKSLGNHIGINELPSEMFGKLMSISDESMQAYYSLLLDKSLPEKPPAEAKKQLAFEIVRTYHSLAAAQKTLDEWNTRFSKRDLARADLPAFAPTERQDFTAVAVVSDIFREIFQAKKSRSEVSRLIKQGSVELDGTKVLDPKAQISLRPGQILRLDRKHAVRID